MRQFNIKQKLIKIQRIAKLFKCVLKQCFNEFVSYLIVCKHIFQLNLFFNYFFSYKMMLIVYILYSKIINKIFRQCLSFLIVAINNNSDKTINKFKNFNNY